MRFTAVCISPVFRSFVLLAAATMTAAWSSAPHSSSFEPQKVGTEVEMRIPITRQGYHRLKESKMFSSAASRDDVYIDVYSNGTFSLENGAPSVKARFMTDSRGSRWQASAVSRRDKIVREGIVALVKENRKSKVTADSHQERAARLAAQAILTDAHEGKVFADRVADVADMLRKNSTMSSVVSAVSDGWPPGWVLPAGQSFKQRLLGELDINGTTVDLVLGQTVRKTGDGHTVTEYEFEADIKGTLNTEVKRLFEDIIDRLVRAGLESRDVVPDEGGSDFGFMQSAYQDVLP